MLDPRVIRRLAGAAAAVTELAITVAIGVAAGTWGDKQLGSAPLLALALSLLALILGFIRLVSTLKRLEEPDDRHPPNP